MADPCFQNIVLSLLLRHQPVRLPESWEGFPRFLTLAQFQGLMYRLTDDPDVLPADILRFVEQAYYSTLAANSLRIERLEALEKRLSSENIPVILLKGAALLDTVYQDPGMRPMEDIDLLVRTGDLPALRKILKQSAYKADDHFPMMFRREDVLIDVHTSLMHTSRIKNRWPLFPMDLEQVFNQSVPWREGFTFVRIPDECTHLIFMAHHMIKHSFSKLIWLVDFFQVVRDREDTFWKIFEAGALQYHQEKPLAYIFYLLKEMFCFLPPQTTVFYQYGSKISGIARVLLRHRSRGHSIGDWGNALWIGCAPSQQAKLQLSKETLFPAMSVLRREHASCGITDSSKIYFTRCARIADRFKTNLDVLVSALHGR